jgi:hypothetical protein
MYQMPYPVQMPPPPHPAEAVPDPLVLGLCRSLTQRIDHLEAQQAQMMAQMGQFHALAQFNERLEAVEAGLRSRDQIQRLALTPERFLEHCAQFWSGLPLPTALVDDDRFRSLIGETLGGDFRLPTAEELDRAIRIRREALAAPIAEALRGALEAAKRD